MAQRTLPGDPELPSVFAQGMDALILDEEAHPDHEALVAGGVQIDPAGDVPFTALDVPG